MRTSAAVAALLLTLVSVGSAQQGGFTTPTDGPESAKLAETSDPTRATVIADADIGAAIRRLGPDGVSANGCSSNVTTPRPLRGSPIDFKLTGAECRRTPTRLDPEGVPHYVTEASPELIFWRSNSRGRARRSR
jgi:hypothetical protein